MDASTVGIARPGGLRPGAFRAAAAAAFLLGAAIALPAAGQGLQGGGGGDSDGSLGRPGLDAAAPALPDGTGGIYYKTKDNPIANALDEISFLVKRRLQGIGLPLTLTVTGEFSAASPAAFLDDFTVRYDLDWFYHEEVVTVTPRSGRVEKAYSFDDQDGALLFRTDLDRLLSAHSGFEFELSRRDDSYLVRITAPNAYQERSTEIYDRLLESREELLADADDQIADLGAGDLPGDSLEAEPERSIMRFEFRHAWVEDRQIGSSQGQPLHFPGVVKILTELVKASRGDVQLAKVPAAAPAVSAQPALLAGGALQGVSPFGAVSDPAASATAQPAAAAAAAPQAAAAPASGPVIAVDPRTNAVLIHDESSYRDFYADLVEDLDRPLQMVELQAMIIDVDKNNIDDLGISWSGRLQGGSTLSVSGGFAIDSTAQLGDINLIVDSGNFLGRLRALTEQGSSKVVSQPSVLAMDNHTANIETKDKFYVRVEGNAQASSALFPVETGTMLNVTPHVIDDAGVEQRRIQLLVSIRDGTINREASALVDSLPTVSERNINTQAVVYHGESLLIGGQVHTTKSESEAAVPGLSELPIFGGLFRKSGTVDRELVRMFLLRPNIVEMSYSRSTATEDALSHIDKESSVLSPTRIHIPPLDGQQPRARPDIERGGPSEGPLVPVPGDPQHSETVRLRMEEAEFRARTLELRSEDLVTR